MKKVARIFEDTNGYQVCSEDDEMLDARGKSYPNKSSALRGASYSGYTHAIGSGTYWGNKVRAIPKQYRES